MSLPATDDFERGNGAVGANWTGSVGGDLTIVSFQCGGGTGSSDNSMYWSADAPNAAQYAQIQLASLTANIPDYSGPLVRTSATDWVILDAAKANSVWKIEWYNGGAWTQIGSTYSSAPVASDIAKITASGSNFEGFVNGTSRITGSNASAPSTGYGGIYIYSNGKYVDNFEVGNLGAGISASVSTSPSASASPSSSVSPSASSAPISASVSTSPSASTSPSSSVSPSVSASPSAAYDTYYVDPVNGNDGSGDGSSGNPWKTIDHAHTAASTGDDIKVRDGTDYSNDGLTINKGVTIEADTGASPKIFRGRNYTSWTKTGGRTNVYHATPINTFSYDGVLNGATMTSLSAVADVATVDATENSFFMSTGDVRLYVHITGGAQPTSILVELGYFRLSTSSITLRGFEFLYGAPSIESSGTSALLEDILTTDNAYYAYADDAILRRCTCNGSTRSFNIQGQNALLEDCLSTDASVDGFAVLAGTSSSATLRRCTAINYVHCGFIVSGSGRFMQTEYCVAYLTQDTAGQVFGFVTEVNSSANWYNCVTAHSKLSSYSGVGYGFYQVDNGSTYFIENCISYDNKYGLNASSGTLYGDYNCFYNNTVDSNVSAGAHDVASDPLFVGTNNFHLTANSPCKDEGLAVAGVTDGYYGTAPDIGAYEYNISYTRGNYASLPADDTDLETAYSAQDLTDVSTSNNIRVSQSAAGEYAIHQFKDDVTNRLSATVTWEGQSDLSPQSSTVYLQIYNRNSSSWYTIDSDNTSDANTDLTLTADINDLSNYKDAGNIISCRVYQQAV